MTPFASYNEARRAGMTFGGLDKSGQIQATDDHRELISWLVADRGFTAFEATRVLEDYRI